MNPLDQQYQSLLQDILDNGTIKGDRTGTGTTSVFGRSIRHHMRDGFPLLTTKKMYTKGIINELLWFLRGDTNIQWLVLNKCNIWVGDAYKKYLHTLANHPTIHANRFEPLSKEDFIEQIKTDDQFAQEYGDLGPIYGEQWRNFGGTKYAQEIDDKGNPTTWENTGGIDQIANMFNTLKNNPDGRRIMVSAWNPQNVHLATLPPCHYGFQVYTRKLSQNARWTWYKKNGGSDMHHDHIEMEMDEKNVPTREVSLLWNQRSVDTFLGLPFNIASYGFLLHIIAKVVNMVPGEIVGFLGDTHLYSNHLDKAREQISRTPFALPSLKLDDEPFLNYDHACHENPDTSIDHLLNDIDFNTFTLTGYECHKKITAELSN